MAPVAELQRIEQESLRARLGEVESEAEAHGMEQQDGGDDHERDHQVMFDPASKDEERAGDDEGRAERERMKGAEPVERVRAGACAGEHAIRAEQQQVARAGEKTADDRVGHVAHVAAPAALAHAVDDEAAADRGHEDEHQHGGQQMR